MCVRCAVIACIHIHVCVCGVRSLRAFTFTSVEAGQTSDVFLIALCSYLPEQGKPGAHM